MNKKRKRIKSILQNYSFIEFLYFEVARFKNFMRYFNIQLELRILISPSPFFIHSSFEISF